MGEKSLAKTVMIQGTGSGVGKSVLVAALCRIFKQDGFQVAPFKAQNMALNSGVTRDGKEMGRAQIMQAQAAGVEPQVEMNPILLKPHADTVAQVIIRGQVAGDMSAMEYHQYKPPLLQIVAESLASLRREYDVIVIEGAGSPAEINLKDHDIVNMRTAELADAPVLLVGDIDRGGVFAWFVGTMELLPPEERKRIRGFIINKFRGDLSLLEPGLNMLEERTGVPVLGVVPFFFDIRIPEEDAVPEWALRGGGEPREDETLDIAMVYLPHISNFTDFDPLTAEPSVRVRYVRLNEELGEPDAVIIPGSKNTIGDLMEMRKQGLTEQIIARAKKGTPIIGICGGYQMLGREIIDEEGVESSRRCTPGLNLLDIVTIFAPRKTISQTKAEVISDSPPFASVRGMAVAGYEIHMGQSRPGSEVQPIFLVRGESGSEDVAYDGAVSRNGLIWGTYLHGLFDNDCFKLAFINWLRARRGWSSLANTNPLLAKLEVEYDKLADLVRRSLNMGSIYEIVGLDSYVGGRDG
jgi:adenosylcobyric acid synthase